MATGELVRATTHYLHVNGHFPHEPKSAASFGFFLHFFQQRTTGDEVAQALNGLHGHPITHTTVIELSMKHNPT